MKSPIFTDIFYMRRIINCLLLITIAYASNAQIFGGFPPSIKWQEINTDTARIIFPPQVTPQAQRIAAIIHRIARERPEPLGNNLRKINVVLHNTTTLANGYVALSPFRSEYYLIPPSDIFSTGANPWYEELPVHEYRHVHQFSNFRNGLSKFASYILGQDGQGLLNAIAVPNWFWEGDAVHEETVLTTQGRGRLPNFFNNYNSLWREQRNYSWMKLRSGSLKDFVPDHYALGYLLVNYGYLKYGAGFWGKVTHDATAFKGLIYPFQKAIEKYSGVDYKTFRNEALSYYSHQVSRKRTDSVQRETVTNYYFAQFVSDDSLLYVKSSYKQLPAFYVRDHSGEHKLGLKNISIEEWFSYRNGTIAYTGYDVNPRWNLIDYSDIYLYNIHTGEQKKITRKAKYFTPDISFSGNNIIAVSVNDSIASELHLMKMNGEVIKVFKSQNNSFFYHPRFIDEDNIVVVERLANATMVLTRIELSTGKREQLLHPIHATVGYPYISGDAVYFVCSIAGNDDVYRLQLNDKKVFQLGTGLTGHYFPTVYNDQLTWSRFTSNGLQLQEKIMQASGGRDVTANFIAGNSTIPFVIAGADSLPNVLNIATRTFPVEPYSKSSYLFNFHSWRLDYSDPEFTVSLYSDNILNYFSNEIFYRYNQDEISHAVGFTTFYGGFFPVLDAGITYTMDRTIKTPAKTVSFNTFEAKAGYSIPLNFTQGKTNKFLDFGTDVVLNNTRAIGFYKDSFAVSNRTYLSHFISWAQYLPKAKQHIYPKFGYTLSIDLRHFINNNEGLSYNSQWLLGAQLFLPSIGNHSIVLSGAFQRVDTGGIRFSNRFSNSRGYDDYYFRKMWRLSGNYHLPLLYPDVGFGNIIFVQRLRANIFYDFTRVYSGYFGSSPVPLQDLRSTGAEIYFDTKVWNELPVSFGFRISHLLDNDFSGNKAGTNVFQFIVPVNIVPSH